MSILQQELVESSSGFKKEIDEVTQARLAAEFIGQVKELQKSEAEGRKSRE